MISLVDNSSRGSAGIRKGHTVAWDKIFQPCVASGLGVPKLLIMNVTLLAKLLWRLIRHPVECSCNLRDKYGGWPALVHRTKMLGSSHIWRALVKIFPLWHVGVRWSLGNGKIVSFWHDA